MANLKSASVVEGKLGLADGMSSTLARNLVPDKGFEPLTIALQMRRSTN
jgi:hypothetical protein